MPDSCGGTRSAVADEAVADVREVSSGKLGWLYCTSGMVRDRGRVFMARSKPATVESFPTLNCDDCAGVSVLGL